MTSTTRGMSALIATLVGIGVVCLCGGLAFRIGLKSLASVQSNAGPSKQAAPTPAAQHPLSTASPVPTNAPLPTNTAVAKDTPEPLPTATTQPVVPTSTPPQKTYVVKQGDTLSSIARQFGVTVDALAQTNHIDNPDQLQIGQKLIIP